MWQGTWGRSIFTYTLPLITTRQCGHNIAQLQPRWPLGRSFGKTYWAICAVNQYVIVLPPASINEHVSFFPPPPPPPPDVDLKIKRLDNSLSLVLKSLSMCNKVLSSSFSLPPPPPPPPNDVWHAFIWRCEHAIFVWKFSCITFYSLIHAYMYINNACNLISTHQ